jgi:MFS family permease
LYLVSKNFSLTQVGYTNFLIYLPIALFAPFIGFINHKVNAAILMVLGILGYCAYSLSMISFPNFFIFYGLQIMLGVSGALFFVSSRAILMGSKLKNPDASFGWFYSAASYADAFAPAVGALFIWRFGFLGVFVAAALVQALAAVFCFSRLRKARACETDNLPVKECALNYKRVIDTIKQKRAWFFILIAFLVLILTGFNNTFFPLYLKSLGWSLNQILVFNSVLSIVFLPISIFAIKQIGKLKSETNLSFGAQITGLFSFALGSLTGILNYFTMFLIMLGQNIGSLISSSGRSGLLATRLIKYPKESAAADTIFSPFATAFGALFGGILISVFGYPIIFVGIGSLIFIVGIVGKRISPSFD